MSETGTMDSGALDTLKEPEKEIPDYPVHRYESNCDKWALEAEMAFAKLGVADALEEHPASVPPACPGCPVDSSAVL